MLRLFLPCLFLLTLQATAQTKFVPGYIVRHASDTTQVFLEEEYSLDLVHKVRYKNSLDATEVRTALPGEISAFGYPEGGAYRSITFVAQPSDSAQTQTCFGMLLLSGEYSLFSYIANDETFYVVQEGDKSYFLNNATYYPDGQIKNKGNYQNQLILLAVACDKSLKNPELVDYDSKGLVNYLESLNKCTAPEKTSTNFYQNSKVTVKPFIFAGGLPMGKQSQVAAEAGVRINNSRLSRKISLNIGVHYSSTVAQYNTFNYGPYEFQTPVLQTDRIISVPFYLQYNFTTGIVQPYVDFGFSAAYLSEIDNATSLDESTSTNKFGVAMVAEAGIEGYITKKLFVRVGWHYELILQYPAVGLAYKF